MKEFLKEVSACDDIQVVKNVVQILVEGMENSFMDKDDMLRTMKEAYSELKEYHYTEELAALYYSSHGIDGEAVEAAKLVFVQGIQETYTEITLWDWVVLFGRMSQNTKGTDDIVEACLVFLDNKFLPWYDLN